MWVGALPHSAGVFPPRDSLAGRRRWVAIFTAAVPWLLLLAARLWLAGRLEVNSDEPQHLHVVWGWAVGLLPYRDLFDNHAPLFQWLMAPLIAMLGERADILLPMRWAMIPFYFATLGATHILSNRLWPGPVALRTTWLVAWFPSVFVVAAQFRPDDLWMLAWTAALALALAGRFGAWRAFSAGTVTGIAFTVSLKTLLLVATFAVAWGAVVMIAVARGARWRRWLRAAPTGAFLAGCVLVPGLAIGCFVAHGIEYTMLYDVVLHNLVPGLGRWQHVGLHDLLLVAIAPMLWMVWRHMPHPAAPADFARASLLLWAGVYLVVLYGYWPLVTHQDLLPVAPAIAMALAVGSTHLPVRGRLAWPRIAFATLLAAELLISAIEARPWENRLQPFETGLARVLRLTTPGDYVMDAKGETIFRMRPVYWVLESVTEARMADGSIADDIIPRLVATETPIVRTERLPPPDLAFVQRNYLPAGGTLYIAGRRLGLLRPGIPHPFTIAVPQDYALIGSAGPCRASFDGGAVSTSARLTAGPHRVTAEAPCDALLVWRPALARGFDPAPLFAH